MGVGVGAEEAQRAVVAQRRVAGAAVARGRRDALALAHRVGVRVHGGRPVAEPLGPARVRGRDVGLGRPRWLRVGVEEVERAADQSPRGAAVVGRRQGDGRAEHLAAPGVLGGDAQGAEAAVFRRVSRRVVAEGVAVRLGAEAPDVAAVARRDRRRPGRAALARRKGMEGHDVVALDGRKVRGGAVAVQSARRAEVARGRVFAAGAARRPLLDEQGGAQRGAPGQRQGERRRGEERERGSPSSRGLRRDGAVRFHRPMERQGSVC